jgi:hypothetical protein
MPISTLSSVTSLTAGDNVAIGSASNGDDRKASMSVVGTYLEGALDFSPSGAKQDYITQYAAPTATGFNVQITDGDDNVHLILTPLASYAAGTIILPTSSNLVDRQEILCNTTQAVTSLTVNGNGATVASYPSFLLVNSFFKLRYDLPGNTWYQVGTSDSISFSGYTVDDAATADTVVLRDSNADIFCNALSSDVATGTAPLTVASTTKVTNLNADLLDDLNSATTATADTIAARDSSGYLTAIVLRSTVATGTSPLTVSSTTVVANLNADQTDGFNAQIASAATTIPVRDSDEYLHASDTIISQGSPAAKTVSATLTAAEIESKIITVNQGAGATSALQLPLATDMSTQFATMSVDQAFDFSLINISTTAAETASITTNTGWTLVGNMLVAANTAITDNSQGRFRARKTGASTWVLYRIV